MKIQLQWDRNSEPDVASYNVYRSLTAGGPYTQLLVSVPQPAPDVGPAFVDDTLVNATFYYVVRAQNVAGMESANSNEVVVFASAPSAPTGLTAMPIVAAKLSVDGAPVSIAAGPVPLSMAYTLKKTVPPRDQQLGVEVAL